MHPRKEPSVLLIERSAIHAQRLIEQLNTLGCRNVAWARDPACAFTLMRYACLRPSLILLDASLRRAFQADLKAEGFGDIRTESVQEDQLIGTLEM